MRTSLGSIGWFGADAVDFLGDRLEDVGDFFSDAADVAISVGGEVPGVRELAELAGEAVQSSYALPVMRAIASTLYGSAAWVVGPQLAAVTWALPGLLRGDRFDVAWLTEFRYRVETTAEIVGPGVVDAFGTQLTEALTKLADEYGVGQLVREGVAELARRLNVREDVAAFALSLWNRITPPDPDDFNRLTGRLLPLAQRPSSFAFAKNRRRTRVEGAAAKAAALSRVAGGVKDAQTRASVRALGYDYAPAPRSPSVAVAQVVEERSTGARDVALSAAAIAAGGAFVWWWSRR